MGKKILIVDDALEVVKLLEFKVKEWGYDVVSTTDSRQCLQMVETEKPDLVLLDILMPEKRGSDICYEIKSKFKIPVILISAIKSISIKYDAKIFGASEFIGKPIDNDELKSKIEKVLKEYKKSED